MSKAKRILYFSPHKSGTADASGVRSKYIIEALDSDYDVCEINGFGGSLVFTLPSNKDSLPKRLVKEVLTGLELGIRLLFKKKDIVVLSSPPFFTVMIISFFLILTRQKYILDIRDIYPEVFFHLNLIKEESVIGKLFKLLTKIIYKYATGITCATDGLKKMIDEYGVETPTKTIFNGYDAEKFSTSEDKFEDFTVLFHGNLAKMQNISLLVDIAEQLEDDVTVLVAGDGPQRDLLENNSIIKFLGRVEYTEIPNLVNKSHVGISLRHDGIINETAFPVKIFEYMGAGLPIISTPHSEAGQFLEKNKLGYQFKNTQVKEMVDLIHKLKAGNNNSVGKQRPQEFSRQFQAKNFKKFLGEITL